MGRRRKYCGCSNEEMEIKVPIKHRNTANARERARMRVLSKAFVKLKTTLPWVPADTKLSKLDTLRLASSYIAHLRQMLLLDADTAALQPISLTWPFVIPLKNCGNSDEKETTLCASDIDSQSLCTTKIKQEQCHESAT